jgi:uncharacterized protein
MVVASREFQVMVKPVGSACNLNCRYCYYLEKKNLYSKRESFRMADDVLENYIIQHIEACTTKHIFFSWHGGEPTLLGLDYFQRIIEIQRKHKPLGRRILNGIQTNGTLLDDEWCLFLARKGFFVGISIDGPKELHDGYRVTKGGKATHKQVMQSYRKLRKYGITVDVLCVVHNGNVRHPAAVYRFFKSIGVQFLQFLPIVVRQGEHGVSAESVPAEEYGTFLCTVFDNWARNDIGHIVIQNFDEAERPYRGEDHVLCIFKETCGDVVVVEHNGDFYSCDHFVDEEHRIGNIRERRLVELLESPKLMEFGHDKLGTLPQYCRECEVLASCNGGCQKDRFALAPDGEEGLNYLCPGYKHFFTNLQPHLQRLASLRRTEDPMEKITDVMHFENAEAYRLTGRNDPCPCGSGKKYKKCCLAKH